MADSNSAERPARPTSNSIYPLPVDAECRKTESPSNTSLFVKLVPEKLNAPKYAVHMMQSMQ